MTHSTSSMSRVLRLARWRTLRWGLLLPMVPILWACNPHPLQAPEPQPEQETAQYVDVNPIREVDILVMVDNSPSMGEEQANLAKNFPILIKQLEAIQGGMPDTQIAVVTSDMGAGGGTVGENCLGYGDGARFQYQYDPGNKAGTGNCGLMDGAKFIKAFNKGTRTNLQAGKTLADVFTCMANRGVRGCGYEHQLQAVRVGLIPQVKLNDTENMGFLRPNAYLAILIVTDEDDCSAPPVPQSSEFFVSDIKGQAPSLRCNTDGHICNGKSISLDPMMSTPLSDCAPNPNPSRLIKVDDFVASIKALKRPDKIIVAGIFGVPQPGKEAGARYSVYPRTQSMNDLTISPVCSTAGLGNADPGLRVKQFIDSFAPNSSVHSICNEDFSPALDAIGKLLADRISNTCVLQPLVDKDPATPEVDPDCLVIDQKQVGMALVDLPLPRCNMGKTNRPCWDITPDAMTCAVSGFRIDVARPDGAIAPPNSKLAIKCRTCTGPDDPRCKRK